MSSTTMVFGELSPSPSCVTRKSDRSSAETRRRLSTARSSKRRPSTDSEIGPQIAPDQSPTRPSGSANSYQTPSTAALKRHQETSPDVFDATIPHKRICASNTKTAHTSERQADSEEMYSQPKTPDTARLTHGKLCKRIRDKLSEDDRTKGFIYVLQDPGRKESVWKIGYTKRVYNERIDEHSNCCNFEPFIAHVSAQAIQNCKLLEKLIHRDLCHKVRYRSCPNKIKGHTEWFEVSEEVAVQTVKKWERFIHEEKPYDSQGNLNVVWSYVLEKRSPAALGVLDMSHDARQEQWADILAPPTYNDYIYAYLAYARSEVKATYDWVYMFFWQLSTILYSLHTLALCRNRPAFYALVFVLTCAVLPNFRLQSTKKQKVSSPNKKARET